MSLLSAHLLERFDLLTERSLRLYNCRRGRLRSRHCGYSWRDKIQLVALGRWLLGKRDIFIGLRESEGTSGVATLGRGTVVSKCWHKRNTTSECLLSNPLEYGLMIKLAQLSEWRPLSQVHLVLGEGQ